MSWIPITRGFALASLCWLAIDSVPQQLAAQTPQLAPPQYGISDGSPSGYKDPGPQPNLAPPPLATPAGNDDREYLRLLNQPVASPTTAVVNPAAPSNPAATNPTQAFPAAANPVAMNPVNVAARPEATAPLQNIQANYQQPVATSVSPTALPPNGPAGNPPPANNTPSSNSATNIQATYSAPATNTAVNNPPRPLNTNGAKPIPLAGPNTKTPAAASSWSSFGTMLGSLAIVLGLFVVTIKLLRRGMPGAKQRLGSNVVEVLGQAPLAPRQTLQVIRFGNKILLVAMSPDGCDTLTEITDPLEVDRVAGMCQQSQANSSTKTFGEMFRQVTSMRPAVNEPLADVTAPSSTLDEVRARLRGGSITGREVTHG